MEETFVYNYWNDLGNFYFDGELVKSDSNGYKVPNKLIDNEHFRLFFNVVSSHGHLNLHGYYITSEDYKEFFEDAGIDGTFERDLFSDHDIEQKKKNLREKLFPKWANQARQIKKNPEHRKKMYYEAIAASLSEQGVDDDSKRLILSYVEEYGIQCA